MKASDVVKQIQEAVGEAEKTGIRELQFSNLNAYLANVLATAVEQERGEPSMTEAQANHQLEVWKAQLSAHSTMSVEMFKSAVEAGQTALRSAIVINGGAAATVLAFAGNAITKGPILPGMPLLTHIGTALLWFMFGLGGAGIATGFRYLSQFAYNVSHGGAARWGRAGAVSNVVSICLGVGSFFAFFVGGVAAYHAIVLPTT
ncbi:hypothetical protein [Paraburkholderia dipogonis]|uniref:hypothetical protein n=1 Tax=Paraburkholderia dipogonis TaxID=1211383 RepID=UPI0038B8BA66